MHESVTVVFIIPVADYAGKLEVGSGGATSKAAEPLTGEPPSDGVIELGGAFPARF